MSEEKHEYTAEKREADITKIRELMQKEVSAFNEKMRKAGLMVYMIIAPEHVSKDLEPMTYGSWDEMQVSRLIGELEQSKMFLIANSLDGKSLNGQ